MGNEVEACPDCVRDDLARPDHPDRQPTNAKLGSTVDPTAPSCRGSVTLYSPVAQRFCRQNARGLVAKCPACRSCPGHIVSGSIQGICLSSAAWGDFEVNILPEYKALHAAGYTAG